MEVCRRFLQGRCEPASFKRKCKFAHPDDAVEIIDNKVKCCKNFARGLCQEEGCKLYHEPKETLANAQETMLRPGLDIYPPQKSFGDSPFGLQPMKSRSFSVLPHPSSSNPHVLQLFQKRQQIIAESQQIYQQVQALQEHLQMLMEKETAISRQMHMIDPTGQFVQQLQNNHSIAAQFQNSTSFAKSRGNTMEVCRDSMKGRCNRKESCRFAHVPDHLKGDAERDGFVTICIDFKRNKCERETCRYFHPPPHILDQLSRKNTYQNGQQPYKRLRSY